MRHFDGPSVGNIPLAPATSPASRGGRVREQRESEYGHPLDNHERIAAFWTVRLRDKLRDGEKIEPHEAAACMRLVKEARLMQTPGHEDSLTDIAGYADVEHHIHEERKRRG